MSGTSRSPLSLNIVIIGAGIAGVSAAYTLGRAGHNVTLFENAPELQEVGAGIQIGPNVTKLLFRWGLEEKLAKVACKPHCFVHRRWSSGEMIGFARWGDKFDKEYGYPFYQIHRADLHNLLIDVAKPYMNLRLGCKVVNVSTDQQPVVTLESGETYQCDVVIAADGVKSFVRNLVVGKPDNPVPTGDAAFRALIPTSELVKDPELAPLLKSLSLTGWIGPQRHIIGYFVNGGRQYNLVMLHPDRYGDLQENFQTKGNLARVREEFAGWEPRVQKLLDLMDDTLIWPLKDRAPLDNWVHPNGRIVLIGDSCHPMLPYRAQGAGMAIEDAASLGVLFSSVTSKSEIPVLLKAFETVRLPRTSEVQLTARAIRKFNHLPDGPEQQARDRSMRDAMEAAIFEAIGQTTEYNGEQNASVWSDKGKNDGLYGYDVEAVTDKWWRRHGSELLALGEEQVSARL